MILPSSAFSTDLHSVQVGPTFNRSSGRKNHRQRPGGDGFDGKGPLKPGIEASGKGPDPRNPPLFQQERRTGARCFIGSDAKQNNLTVPRDPVMLRFKVFNGKVEGARNGLRLFTEFNGIPKIEDQDVLTGVKLLFDLFGRDPYDGQVTEKALSLKIFGQDISGNAHGNDPG